MRKLALALSLVSLAVRCSAQTIPGTVIAAKITTGSSNSTFAIGDTLEMSGTPKQVPDMTSMTNIPAARRTQGMTCYVNSTGQEWRLVGGIADANWTLLPGAPGSIAFYASGDSRTRQPYELGRTNWPYWMAGKSALWNSNVFINGAVDGHTVAAMLYDLTNNPSAVALGTNQVGYAFVWGSINDLSGQSATGDYCYSYLTQIWSALRSYGYKVVAFREILASTTQQPGTAKYANWMRLNYLISSNPSLYDYLVYADAVITNWSYQTLDGVHPTPAASAALATEIARVIENKQSPSSPIVLAGGVPWSNNIAVFGPANTPAPMASMVVSAPQPQSISANVISSPGFEMPNSLSYYWWAGDGSPALTTSNPHSGTNALQMPGGASIWQSEAWSGGGTASFSYWTRGDGSNGGWINVLDSTDGVTLFSSGRNVVTSTNWTLVSGTMQVPITCRQIIVYVNAGASGNAYFDDLSLTHSISGPPLALQANPWTTSGNLFEVQDGYGNAMSTVAWNGAATELAGLTVGSAAVAVTNTALVVSPVLPSIVGSSLVSDPGFEMGGNSLSAYWGSVVGDGAIAITNGMWNGSNAVAITAGPSANTLILQTDSPTSGAVYQFSVFTHGDGIADGQIGLYDITHASYVLAVTNTGNISTFWRPFTYTFTNPAGCSQLRIFLSCPSVAGSTAWYDNAAIYPVQSGLGMVVQGGIYQTSDVFQVRSSSGSPLLQVSNGGVVVPGSAQFQGTNTVTAQTVATQALNPAANNITDSSYELGGNSLSVYWGGVAGDGAATLEHTNSHTGTNAMALTAGATQNTYIYQNVTTGSGLLPGSNYVFSCWTHGDGVNAGWLYLWDSTEAKYLMGYRSTGISGTGWAQFSFAFTVPVGCATLKLYIGCPVATGGIAWYDDITLAPINPYPPLVLAAAIGGFGDLVDFQSSSGAVLANVTAAGTIGGNGGGVTNVAGLSPALSNWVTSAGSGVSSNAVTNIVQGIADPLGSASASNVYTTQSTNGLNGALLPLIQSNSLPSSVNATNGAILWATNRASFNATNPIPAMIQSNILTYLFPIYSDNNQYGMLAFGGGGPGGLYGIVYDPGTLQLIITPGGSVTASSFVGTPGPILTNGWNGGTVTISNNIAADSGHQFSGNGAGLTNVTATVSPNGYTLTNTLGTETWIDFVRDFGGVGDGVTDNSSNLQAAINFAMLGANNQSPSAPNWNTNTTGTIYFRPGKYAITNAPFGTWNSQIYIPFKTNAMSCSIIKLVAQPDTGFYPGSLTGGRYSEFPVRIFSTVTNAGCLFCLTNYFTNNVFPCVKFEAVGIQFSSLTNSWITPLQLNGMEHVLLRDCSIASYYGDATIGAVNLPQPQAGTIGVELPDQNCGDDIKMEHVQISGYETGLKFSEHFHGYDLHIQGCVSCIVTKATAQNDSCINGIVMEDYKYGLNFNAACGVNIIGADFERAASGAWYTTVYDVYDPSIGYALGSMTYGGYDRTVSQQISSLMFNASGGGEAFRTKLQKDPWQDVSTSVAANPYQRGPYFQHFGGGYGSGMSIAHARGTPSSATIVNSGDGSTYQIGAYDGSAWQFPIVLQGLANGSMSAGSIPMDFVLYTSNSTANISERLRVDSAGKVNIQKTLNIGQLLTLTNSLTIRSNTAALAIPSAPTQPGDCFVWNSNGTPYMILSTNGGGAASASWTGTNYAGGSGMGYKDATNAAAAVTNAASLVAIVSSNNLGQVFVTNSIATSAGADYTFLYGINVCLLGAAHKATLPGATTNAGRVLTIINTGSGTNGIFAIGSQTINGVATATGITNAAQYSFKQLLSDGANWWIIGNQP